MGEVVRVGHQPFLPEHLGLGPRGEGAGDGGGVQADGGEPAGGDGDERGRRGGWASGGDDGPELAGDVQYGGADAADTAGSLVGEGCAVVGGRG